MHFFAMQWNSGTWCHLSCTFFSLSNPINDFLVNEAYISTSKTQAFLCECFSKLRCGYWLLRGNEKLSSEPRSPLKFFKAFQKVARWHWFWYTVKSNEFSISSNSFSCQMQLFFVGNEIQSCSAWKISANFCISKKSLVAQYFSEFELLNTRKSLWARTRKPRIELCHNFIANNVLSSLD